ncbi:MAG: hypothetical protein JSV88_21115 [Candidatus Aminicenantes bacterium]|nr:MAG: hypothetical protein JSV88_21115 [Candidatus Aminicenantes bacterium]
MNIEKKDREKMTGSVGDIKEDRAINQSEPSKKKSESFQLYNITKYRTGWG